MHAFQEAAQTLPADVRLDLPEVIAEPVSKYRQDGNLKKTKIILFYITTWIPLQPLCQHHIPKRVIE